MTGPLLAAGPDGLAVLKLLALEGGTSGDTKISCSDLGDRLDVSTQTASRRLKTLDDGGFVDRDIVTDGQWVTITPDGERVLRSEYADYRRIFEQDAGVTLRGTVTGGMGEGRHYIALPGYMAQFEDRLGYTPFVGTLNVELDDASTRRRSALAGIDPVPIDGWEDDERTYGPAVCYPVSLEAPTGDTYDDAHIIAPERTHHDESHLELIAPDRLRDALSLEDDDELTIHVRD